MHIFLLLFLLIIFYIIFYILNIKLYKKDVNIKFDKSIELIISRYNENLEWTLDKPFNNYKYIVYNKGNNDNFEKKNIVKIINLKNVGRESHTYLYHVINNYNNLSDIIVFLPGSINMNYKKRKAIKLLETIEEKNNAIFLSEYYSKNATSDMYYFQLNNYESNYIKNQNENVNNFKLSNIRPFGKWYNNTFNNRVLHNISFWGIFSVSKYDILKNNVNDYELLLKQLNDSSNPEVGHYFERSWERIFNISNTNTKILKYNNINMLMICIKIVIINRSLNIL